MNMQFPEGFLWGTSTSAFQVETAFSHDWKGLKARDGSVLERTIDHEVHRYEDSQIISSIGNAYRFSLDWSKLQKEPYGEFDPKTVHEYRSFMAALKSNNMHLMLVLHHFANPKWFSDQGSWLSKKSSLLFSDYVEKVVGAFGDLVDSWNTINEPTIAIFLPYLSGMAPPYRKSLISSKNVLANMQKAHDIAYYELKAAYPEKLVGISNNTFIFDGEGFIGKNIARLLDYLVMEYVPDKFSNVDFIGLSYYGRISSLPMPITALDNASKLDSLGRKHDKLWEYYPHGLEENLIRMHKRYDKPLIITENGICTDDDEFRVKGIIDHITAAFNAIMSGADLKGYFHWSTFDNFELVLGNSYRYGLVEVDYSTMKRTPKKSAEFYSNIAKVNGIVSSRRIW